MAELEWKKKELEDAKLKAAEDKKWEQEEAIEKKKREEEAKK